MADRVGHQLGHYHLLRKIGQGAFAEVYLGEHLYLERLAAIKVLHVQMESETHEQFRREARTIANLQHPHIVQVHDFGLDNQTPYLAMEYTPGGTLRERHPKGTQLSFEQIVTYVKQIASALDYAHELRVIHRDVKPANLLLNARGEVVLSDFGLAVVHRTRESLSPHGPAGTPLYMAPEQMNGKPSPQSDQYALGIMVYQWLCGEPPFSGQLYAVYAQHLSASPPSLCERLPDLPVAVEEAVFKALAKDPAHRFACVADFASALEHACSATQLFTLQELAQSQTDGSFSTEPEPLTLPRAGRGQEAGALLVPGLLLHPQSGSKGIKPSLAQSNRQRLLAKVRAFWITGVLEHSLHGAALIALGLREQPDAVANPWHLVMESPNQPARALPPGTHIAQAYDEAVGELLILGEPGSGKTTLLLELARTLLARAEREERHPMPVIFNLSSWANKKQPLLAWLIEELNTKYQVPRKLGKAWVETDQILPLLDGLDEVAPASRAACVEAINAYRLEHGLVPTVVCSRSAQYPAEGVQVLLRKAVVVQALTTQQIEDHLASAGKQVEAVRVMLRDDPWLQEMVSTPLMLSIVTLTYHGKALEDLPPAKPSLTRFPKAVVELRMAYSKLLEARPSTGESQQALTALHTASEHLFSVGRFVARRQQVFAAYVERMLQRRRSERRYTSEQTVHWLSWLARQLIQQNQTLFSVECMQLDWLSGSRSRWAYRLGLGLAVVLSLLLSLLLGNLLLLGAFVIAGLSVDQMIQMIRPSVIRPFALLEAGLMITLGLSLLVVLATDLSAGGRGYVRSFILRWLLWRGGSIPWNYSRFLDYAAEHILLRKVGGGYIFVHRLLLEYFATLDTTAAPDATSAKRNRQSLPSRPLTSR